MKKYIKFTGDKLRKKEVLEHSYTINRFDGSHTKQEEQQVKEKIAPYYPSSDLVASVEYARLLKRPLLLRGEPGCGKTKLAQALAYELYGEKYRDLYFEWNIKSTSKATEGLYIFDHLARLRDAQSGEVDKAIHEYRRFGSLGKAFISSTSDQPSVLLIDEIDKADIDFPNDLLLELDQKRFFIEETNEEIIAKHPPIIIITSNDERELPNAFLRRCVFHYIDFPSDELLLKIIQGRSASFVKEFQEIGISSSSTLDKNDLKGIVQGFRKLYNKMDTDSGTKKNVSTSELIDWLKIIHYEFASGRFNRNEDGSLPIDDLVRPEVLLKNLDDQKIGKK